MQLLILYFSILTYFLVIDALWLGYIAKNLYYKNMQPLLREQIDCKVAAAFYALYILGILIFVVEPAIERQKSFYEVACRGALFGFFCYGTYNFTNMAVLKGWSKKLSFIDLTWGTILTASASLFGFGVFKFVIGG